MHAVRGPITSRLTRPILVAAAALAATAALAGEAIAAGPTTGVAAVPASARAVFKADLWRFRCNEIRRQRTFDTKVTLLKQQELKTNGLAVGACVEWDGATEQVHVYVRSTATAAWSCDHVDVTLHLPHPYNTKELDCNRTAKYTIRRVPRGAQVGATVVTRSSESSRTKSYTFVGRMP
jgi:hypothetical protein